MQWYHWLEVLSSPVWFCCLECHFLTIVARYDGWHIWGTNAYSIWNTWLCDLLVWFLMTAYSCWQLQPILSRFPFYYISRFHFCFVSCGCWVWKTSSYPFLKFCPIFWNHLSVSPLLFYKISCFQNFLYKFLEHRFFQDPPHIAAESKNEAPLYKVYSKWSYAFLDLQSSECKCARKSTCFVSKII